MAPLFEQLATADTPAGEVSLRRRWEPALARDVHEVKLGDEYLMSSLFTVAEEELARLGLAAVAGDALDVVVGGLGLGCTARTALADARVRELVVVDAFAAVIDWHREGLLPEAAVLTDDERTRFVHGDVFALNAGDGFDPAQPGRRFHAMLLDVDHSPSHHLHPSHASFYTAAGLTRMAGHLVPGGVFALWSDDPPEDGFVALLHEVFAAADAHVVAFPNHYTGTDATNTVYVAVTAGG